MHGNAVSLESDPKGPCLEGQGELRNNGKDNGNYYRVEGLGFTV